MDKQELIAMASAVEKLEGPCREMDLAIMCALDLRPDWLAKSQGHMWIDRGGVNPVIRWCDDRMKEGSGNPSVDDGPRYTASIDAAMTLAPTGYIVGLVNSTEESPYEARGGSAFIGEPGDGPKGNFQASAATPALALCATSLRAIASQEGE